MRQISKRFDATQVLREANLKLQAGRVHVLLGENGAGKSTLMKILCSQIRADAGEVLLDGKVVNFAHPHAAQRAGVAMIHQELNLVDQLSVAQNIVLGREPRRGCMLDDTASMKQARELCSQLGADLDPNACVGTLTVAERQLVEIAKALRDPCRVMIMDEPTSALAVDEISRLFSVIKKLCANDVAVVYISHRMDELFAIGDEITVLRDGQSVALLQASQTSHHELVELMVGRPLTQYIEKTRVQPGREVLRVKHVLGPGIFQPVSLSVRSGEILGICGLMGSGRTELAKLIFGASDAASGEVWVDETQVKPKSPRHAIAAGMGFVSEDRKGEGLVLRRSVQDNIALALNGLHRDALLDAPAERKLSQSFIERLKIKTAGAQQLVQLLSGGNQQKVVLAKWLATDCKVLILDEPTRGIDVAAKSEIYSILGELVQRGLALVIISSELPEILALADRVAVMREGVLQGIVSSDLATQEKIMSMALGL